MKQGLEIQKYIQGCVWTTVGKKPRCREEGNIKMNLQLIMLDSAEWIHSAQGTGYCRVPSDKVMNLRIPLKTQTFLTSRATVSLLRGLVCLLFAVFIRLCRQHISRFQEMIRYWQGSTDGSNLQSNILQVDFRNMFQVNPPNVSSDSKKDKHRDTFLWDATPCRVVYCNQRTKWMYWSTDTFRIEL